jgi:hypothetical protein
MTLSFDRPFSRRLLRVTLPLLACAAAAPVATATILAPPAVTNSAPPFNASFAAANTVDNTEFEYASMGQGVDTFLEYSFGTPQTFDRIVVMNRNSAGQSDYIGDFTLTFDGGVRTASVTRVPIRGASQLHSFGAPATATTVRLDVDTVGAGDTFNNTGAMEVLFVRVPAGHSIISASVIGAATEFNPFFSATNAVDGDIGRSSAPGGVDGPEYASLGLGADAFVDFDLGAQLPVGGFDFFDRPADEDRVTGFDMIFSPDPTFDDANNVVRSYNNTAIATGDVFTTPLQARYVRFDVTANAGANTGMTEMVFYQVPEPSVLGLIGLAIAPLLRRPRR